jgi:hypothetical protein
MQTLTPYSDFLNEQERFDTKLVQRISELTVGDEVFELGVWKIVDRVEGDSAVLVDPVRGYKSRVTQEDLDELPALVKIPL